MGRLIGLADLRFCLSALAFLFLLLSLFHLGEMCSIRVLAGGTAAWKAAGLPLDTGMGALANEPDDVALSARERSADRERYMREYLAWEIDLVNQIARDTDCRFRLAPLE